MALEQIGTNTDEGAVMPGRHLEVISGLAGGTTARQLLASESGSLCLFDDAAGQIYILPAPVVGMVFDFLTTVAGTSNSHSIDTDASTTFMGGGVAAVSTAVAEGGDSFVATISSTVSLDMDSDVTGRLVGSAIRAVALSSTTWGISGTTHGVGTLATPFA
ncbi:MAG: hypothetical protein JKY22_12085 [Flavobacteriaceae bacterium]|nr:hypothetical protein [Flavobacteriaceae bacterium]PCJ26488.1 MAG: hypothetical protein COA94_05105 [Rickettsiales bacterium]